MVQDIPATVVKKFPAFMDLESSSCSKSSPLNPILIQLNTVHTFTYHFSRKHSDIIFIFISKFSNLFFFKVFRSKFCAYLWFPPWL